MTLALVVILFEGGSNIGLRRFRASAAPILALGVLGTFGTAALVAVAAHYALGFSWTVAGLIGAALAPTDPAVTFSVLAGRDVGGRSGTILEGESGFNDPVGIALMIGMVELATHDDASLWTIVDEFVREMAIGLAVGVAGALALAALIRRAPLPDRTLYPIAVILAVGAIYGAAAVAHGSGFLAVFVAGILVGDMRYAARRAVRDFNSALTDLGELAAFVALGLTVDLALIGDAGLWWQGLVLAALLGLVIRPLVVTPLLLPARLDWGERGFVVWSGLKGAVPILLASLAVVSGTDDAVGDLRDRVRGRPLLGGRPGLARALRRRPPRCRDGAGARLTRRRRSLGPTSGRAARRCACRRSAGGGAIRGSRSFS